MIWLRLFNDNLFSNSVKSSNLKHCCDYFSDNRVRGRVCTFFRENFETLEAAEVHYNLTLSGCLEELTLNEKSNQVKVTNKYTQTAPHRPANLPTTAAVAFDLQNIPVDLRLHIIPCFPSLDISSFPMFIKKLIGYLEPSSLSDIGDFCFMELVKTTSINSNPADFISRSIRCMESLQVHGKSNLLYKFAFCITEKCPETDKPILLMDRMPFGLIEYQLEFFACTNIMQVL